MITKKNIAVAKLIQDLMIQPPNFDKKRLPTSDDLQKLVSRLDSYSAHS